MSTATDPDVRPDTVAEAEGPWRSLAVGLVALILALLPMALLLLIEFLVIGPVQDAGVHFGMLVGTSARAVFALVVGVAMRLSRGHDA